MLSNLKNNTQHLLLFIVYNFFYSKWNIKSCVTWKINRDTKNVAQHQKCSVTWNMLRVMKNVVDVKNIADMKKLLKVVAWLKSCGYMRQKKYVARHEKYCTTSQMLSIGKNVLHLLLGRHFDYWRANVRIKHAHIYKMGGVQISQTLSHKLKAPNSKC